MKKEWQNMIIYILCVVLFGWSQRRQRSASPWNATTECAAAHLWILMKVFYQIYKCEKHCSIRGFGSIQLVLPKQRLLLFIVAAGGASGALAFRCRQHFFQQLAIFLAAHHSVGRVAAYSIYGYLPTYTSCMAWRCGLLSGAPAAAQMLAKAIALNGVRSTARKCLLIF